MFIETIESFAVYLYSFIKRIYFLRRYLQEIGYTDTIIDVRSNKVKTLLGLNNINNNNTNNNNNPNSQEECIPAPGSQTVNGNANVSKNKRLSATQGRGNTKKVYNLSLRLLFSNTPTNGNFICSRLLPNLWP